MLLCFSAPVDHLAQLGCGRAVDGYLFCIANIWLFYLSNFVEQED
jgi:hypothetical protein